jgi:aryl-alcohol dehydrogenase-like predicted oxidoreductase
MRCIPFPRCRASIRYPPEDYRSKDPRLQGANFGHNMRTADAVRALALAKQATPGQIALAWLLHQGTDIVPIPGTKRRRYLEENLKAPELSLSSADLQTLEQAIPPGSTSGERYGAQMMSLVDR